MLEVIDLHAGYGRVPILTGVNLGVGARAFVGILGHNGMGKTTLLRTLMGLVRSTSGRIIFGGVEITHWPPYSRSRHKIAYVPQGRRIFPTLTVLENLQLAASSHHRNSKAAVERIVSEFPRLEKLAGRIGGTLSGGEQQLLAIARALCTAPNLLLLDEPTEGIQPSIRDELVSVLLTLKSGRQMAVLLVEQNVDFISATCDRILIMEKGRLEGEFQPRHSKQIDLDFKFSATEVG